MNVERMRMWSEVLERVRQEGGRFRMNYWVEPPLTPTIPPKQPSCDTAACAAGWAAAAPEFQALGLRLATDTRSDGVSWLIPEYLHHRRFDAIAEFFGLSNVQTHWLCSIHRYHEPRPVTIEDVQARIQQLITMEVRKDGTRQA